MKEIKENLLTKSGNIKSCKYIADKFPEIYEEIIKLTRLLPEDIFFSYKSVNITKQKICS